MPAKDNQSNAVQSVADAVAAGPVKKPILTPVEILMRCMGMAKITAQSTLTNCKEQERQNIEHLAAEGNNAGVVKAIHDIRTRLLEEQKANVK